MAYVLSVFTGSLAAPADGRSEARQQQRRRRRQRGRHPAGGEPRLQLVPGRQPTRSVPWPGATHMHASAVLSTVRVLGLDYQS